MGSNGAFQQVLAKQLGGMKRRRDPTTEPTSASPPKDTERLGQRDTRASGGAAVSNASEAVSIDGSRRAESPLPKPAKRLARSQSYSDLPNRKLLIPVSPVASSICSKEQNQRARCQNCGHGLFCTAAVEEQDSKFCCGECFWSWRLSQLSAGTTSRKVDMESLSNNPRKLSRSLSHRV